MNEFIASIVDHIPILMLWADGFIAVLIIGCMIWRAEIAAGTLFGLLILANLFFFWGNPAAWLALNWDKVIEGAAIYLLFGAVWGVIRWFIYLNSSDTKLFIASRYKDWQTFVKDGTPFKNSTYYPFSFRNDSGMITAWVLLWPFSIVWTFLSEFLVRIWDHIWSFTQWCGKSFSKIYARMAENTVDNVLKDLDNTPKK